MGYKPEMGLYLDEDINEFNIYYMEKELDKLDSYLKEHYINIEDNVYLFFEWILNNKEYIVALNSLTLVYKNQFIEFSMLKEANI